MRNIGSKLLPTLAWYAHRKIERIAGTYPLIGKWRLVLDITVRYLGNRKRVRIGKKPP